MNPHEIRERCLDKVIEVLKSTTFLQPNMPVDARALAQFAECLYRYIETGKAEG